MNRNGLNNMNKALTGMGITRSKVRKGNINGEQVTDKTPFAFTETTDWNEQSNTIVTTEEAVHHVLACGCRVSSPSQVQGVCTQCAPGRITRWVRPFRYVCPQCGMCIRCRKKQERRKAGPGCLGLLISLVLWAIADVNWDEKP